jgi:aldehyde:ferredoxin oxidoreductase
MQDSTAIIDSLIMCMFTVDLGSSVELYARCANLPTGMSITAADVYTIGERINTLERLFNIEEGFTRADDALPARFATEAAPSDPGEHTLDVATVLDEYYAERLETRGSSREDQGGALRPAFPAAAPRISGQLDVDRRRRRGEGRGRP